MSVGPPVAKGTTKRTDAADCAITCPAKTQAANRPVQRDRDSMG
jgi:hypothetical protein